MKTKEQLVSECMSLNASRDNLISAKIQIGYEIDKIDKQLNKVAREYEIATTPKYRKLCFDEKGIWFNSFPRLDEIERKNDRGWTSGWGGTSADVEYRTKLSRQELWILRNKRKAEIKLRGC